MSIENPFAPKTEKTEGQNSPIENLNTSAQLILAQLDSLSPEERATLAHENPAKLQELLGAIGSLIPTQDTQEK